MKRIGGMIVTVLMMLMVCGVMGCAKESKPTPQDIYASAYEKMNSLSDLAADMSMDLSMTAGGETMNTEIDAFLLVEDSNSDDMKIDMRMELIAMGFPVELQSYYTDGYYLMETVGMKIKYKMPREEAVEQTALMQEIAVDALTDIVMVQEEDGCTLDFTVDPQKIIDGYLDSYLNNMGMTDANQDLKYTSIQGVMKIDEEGYPTELSMEIEFVMGINGMSVDCAAEAKVVYYDPGAPVTVVLPDISEYIEVELE